METLSPTVVVRDVQGQTFEGAGVFEGVGTLNGTGLFAGQGDFSGPMVQPGSFYKTGLLPGVYNMFAVLPNGRQVLLPDPVTVGVEASYDVEMTMPGAVFADVLEDMEGNVLPDTIIELVDTVLGLDEAVTIVTDETAASAKVRFHLVSTTTVWTSTMTAGMKSTRRSAFRTNLRTSRWLTLCRR